MIRNQFDAVVFDLDGVITRTATVHFNAWKQAFDEYLQILAQRAGEPVREFSQQDYLDYVDGKPRYEGVRSFLESRGIDLPFGEPSDAPDKDTVCGIGNRKNRLFLRLVKRDGVEVFEPMVEFIKSLKAAGVKVGVASSSKNCQSILQAAELEDLFETRVDGVVSAQLGLKGKPEGDIFVRAARNLGVHPGRAVVIEDATSGVAAGRNGGFGCVVGVAREHNEEELLEHGADLVVPNMAGITPSRLGKWFDRKPPCLTDVWLNADEISIPLDGETVQVNPVYFRSGASAVMNGKPIALFLDYDGTLTPIVSRPQDARISEEMRTAVRELSRKVTVAVVSGRMREDVQELVGVENIFYAGSHGFDIAGPDFRMVHPDAEHAVSLVTRLVEESRRDLGDIDGILVEEKKFSLALHYRLVDEDKYLGRIRTYARQLVADNPGLRLMEGRKVFEILPDIDWNKGMAVRWIMDALHMRWETVSAVYIGDDTTDEDAFRVLRTRGTGILVTAEPRASAAHFLVHDPDDVLALFRKILAAA